MVKRNSLETVSTGFSEWRSQRGSPGARIPLGLQNQAIELLQSHSKSQVIKALKIDHGMLKRWQQRHTDTSGCEFVRLVSEPVTESSPSSLQVTLRNAHGSQLTITGLTIPQLTILVQNFTSSAGETL